MISKKTLLLGLGLGIFVNHLKSMDPEKTSSREKQKSDQADLSIERIEPPVEEVFCSAVDRVLAKYRRLRHRDRLETVIYYEEGSGVGLDPLPAPSQPALPLITDNSNNPHEEIHPIRVQRHRREQSFMKDNYAHLIALGGVLTCAAAYIYNRFFSHDERSNKKVYRRNR